MIDITELTNLISAFRTETQKDSISPETVGAILQRIADLLETASSDQETVVLEKLQENFKTLGSFLVSIAQGDTDRNNVLADMTMYDPTTGLFSAQRGTTFIKQATTERAGAMRAQQVIDLNTAKSNIKTLQTDVANLKTFGVIEGNTTFSTETDDGSFIEAKCYRHNSLATIIGNAYISENANSVSTKLPVIIPDGYTPQAWYYCEDTMQWVRVWLYNDLNGSHISVDIPEDFQNGMEASVNFSITCIVEASV